MREWCGCGASIRARRSDVLRWRDSHVHEGRSEPEAQPQGAFSYYARSDGAKYIPPVEMRRIGFVPNDH